MRVGHFLGASVTLALLSFLAGTAQGDSPERAIGAFSYSTSPEVVVLELMWSGGFGAGRMGPFTRIYGDGRVHVRRSRTSRNAGDYEAWLSLKDLDELLSLVVSKGLMDFDTKAVKELQMEAARERLKKTGGEPVVTDAGTVNLFIDLYRRNETRGNETGDVSLKAISWPALSYVVEWYPNVAPLRNLQEMVDTVQLLAKGVERAARGEEAVVSLADILGG